MLSYPLQSNHFFILIHCFPIDHYNLITIDKTLNFILGFIYATVQLQFRDFTLYLHCFRDFE
jgi:hypothetical protein